ncbi:membrane integrity-associated transporter subunit PqiC [Aquabacterium sp.]|uniref:PqiC family protein n=1 Tax=Aquabacterium sp. TaxID=1872578 RepID=UPI0035AEAA15
MMRRPLLCLLLPLALAGCASAPPATTLLALPSLSAPTTSTTAPATPLWAVRRVKIPEYLQATQVRYRDTDSTLAEWPQARWAERLEIGLSRHLLQSLQAQLGTGAVCESVCSTSADGGELVVDYLSLDYRPATGMLQAQVSWRLIPAAAGKAPRSGQLQLSEAVNPASAAGQAAAMGRLNAALAQQLAALMRF